MFVFLKRLIFAIDLFLLNNVKKYTANHPPYIS